MHDRIAVTETECGQERERNRDQSNVGLRLDAFLEANGIDPTKIELPLSEEEIERMLENRESPAIRFSPVAAIPLSRD